MSIWDAPKPPRNRQNYILQRGKHLQPVPYIHYQYKKLHGIDIKSGPCCTGRWRCGLHSRASLLPHGCCRWRAAGHRKHGRWFTLQRRYHHRSPDFNTVFFLDYWTRPGRLGSGACRTGRTRADKEEKSKACKATITHAYFYKRRIQFPWCRYEFG